MSRHSGYARVQHEFYQEDGWATDMLVRVEPPFSGIVMDPCCGEGTIPQRLVANGIGAIGADIVERWNGALSFDDFRTTVRMWKPQYIVSNPPYSEWQDLVDVAFEVGCERVCLLLPIRNVEGIDRINWYAHGKLARLWCSPRRIQCRPGVADVKRGRGSTTYAWFVFERNHADMTWQGGWLPLPEANLPTEQTSGE